MKWQLIYGNYPLDVNKSLNTHIHAYFFYGGVTVMFEVSWSHKMACGDVRPHFGKVSYLLCSDDGKPF
jgi:hypothetical protein